MTLDELKSHVTTIIGENTEKDYVIEPKTHARIYQDKAPELAALLSSTEVQAMAEEYTTYDAKAGLAQKDFKKWSKWANCAIFLTAVFTAGLLASSIIFVPKEDYGIIREIVIGFFTVCSIVSSVFAGMCISRIKNGKLLENWMGKRAEAENNRIDYFKVITGKIKSLLPANPPLAMFILEYFRRYQMDVQLAFYERRSQDHENLAKKALTMSTAAIAVVALINALAGYLGSRVPMWGAVATLAVIAQAFANKVTNTEAVNQDGRNAERYERTRSILAKLKGKLDTIREALFNGEADLVAAYIEQVNNEISAEHRQWNEERSAGITGTFESQLAEYKEKRQTNQGGAASNNG